MKFDNNLIRSFGGNDDISGKDGADRIEGGTGEDTLDGGAGNDIVLGEAGSDIVAGDENDDRLYAETEYTLKINKYFKKLFFGVILAFFINQNAFCEKYNVNSAINEDFVAWSNSMPNKKAGA